MTALPLLLLCALSTGARTADDDEPKASDLRVDLTEDVVPPEGEAGVFELQRTLRRLNDAVSPSIVCISTYARLAEGEGPEGPEGARWVRDLEQHYPGFRRLGGGSGVVVSAAGHVLTNRHLLLGEGGEVADLIDVETVDNRHSLCRVVGLEPTLNLAILQFDVYSDGSSPRFEPIVFGNSYPLQPGHLTVALGDPLGPEKYMNLGLLAATPSRECYQEQLTASYLQVVLQAHPGAYGGALLDLHGRFVGMLVPREPGMGIAGASTGVEFALPSNIIRGIYPAILANESRRSPWLGFAVVSMVELQRELGLEAFLALDRPLTGIRIENVFSPSPAHEAGIRSGDFLTRFGEAPIGTPIDFQRQLYMAGEGREVQLEFYRGGESFTVELQVEVRPEAAVTR